MKTLFYVLFLAQFFLLNSYEGEIESLFSLLSEKSYHVDSEGKESQILTINGIDDFIKNVLKNPKPVICLIYSSSSNESIAQKKFFEWISNDKNFLSKVDFIFIDLALSSNADLLNKLTDLFVQCLMQLTFLCGSDNKYLSIKNRIGKILQNLVIAKKSKIDFYPVVVFFKESNLIISSQSQYLNKKDLLEDINQQLYNSSKTKIVK